MPPTHATRSFSNRNRLVIATPCYGGNVKLDYMNALFRASTELAVPVSSDSGRIEHLPLVAGRLCIDKESHIDRARNRLVNHFLRDTDADRLLFIDADIVFEPAHVLELWRHGMRGHAVVAAPYAQKRVTLQYAFSPLTGARVERDGLIEVSHAGTGFLLLHRRALNALAQRGLAPEYRLGANDPDRARHGSHRAYFKSGVREVQDENGVQEAQWLSEDFMLCHELRQCGYRVMLDSALKLGHVGDVRFPIASADSGAAAPSNERHPPGIRGSGPAQLAAVDTLS